MLLIFSSWIFMLCTSVPSGKHSKQESESECSRDEMEMEDREDREGQMKLNNCMFIAWMLKLSILIIPSCHGSFEYDIIVLIERKKAAWPSLNSFKLSQLSWLKNKLNFSFYFVHQLNGVPEEFDCALKKSLVRPTWTCTLQMYTDRKFVIKLPAQNIGNLRIYDGVESAVVWLLISELQFLGFLG